MAAVEYLRYALRGYTAAELASRNEVLYDRELCIEVDTGRCKRGDGSTPWNDLPYYSVGLGNVDLSTLADGTTLVWDTALGLWIAAPAGPSPATLAATMARISMRC